MSDVSAIFGILITLGIAFPGMLTTWRLLFPATVEHTRQRIEATPWSCWWLGLAIAIVVAIPILILISLPFGPAKFIGWTLAVMVLGLSGLGAAGLVSIMGREINRTSLGVTAVGAFVRAAVALELAAVFPVVGWFLVIPLTTITSLGATGFALLHWKPRKKEQVTASVAVSSQA